jgi:hypothetical protein
MQRFAVGQYVELRTTVPSRSGGSVPSGTRAIVRDVDADPDDARYLVVVLHGERPIGEALWLEEPNLIEA